jgi:hypothetical protein
VKDSHFLRKWFGQSFPMEDSLSTDFIVTSAGGMAQLGEWFRFKNRGQSFPRVDSFYPSCIVISDGGMDQLG